MSEKPYQFFIDGKEYESAQRYITGAHREENERGSHPPDREIAETYSVDLAEPGEEKFYTLHCPTMDIS